MTDLRLHCREEAKLPLSIALLSIWGASLLSIVSCLFIVASSAFARILRQLRHLAKVLIADAMALRAPRWRGPLP